MKNYREIIRKRLEKNYEKLRVLVNGEKYRDKYGDVWYKGGDWDDRKETLQVVNSILKDIPESFWPKRDSEVGIYTGKKIRFKKMSVTLCWSHEDNPNIRKRHADVKASDNDHTAWVEEMPRKPGVFKDFDIGGS